MNLSPQFDAAGVRRISCSPSFAIASYDCVLDQSRDVDEGGRHGTGETSPVLPPFSKAQCRTAMPVYAPASMTDLKVSVTASVGMQARHRMPLQIWSMIMGILRNLAEFWGPLYRCHPTSCWHKPNSPMRSANVRYQGDERTSFGCGPRSESEPEQTLADLGQNRAECAISSRRIEVVRVLDWLQREGRSNAAT
jgi:hypothetical protein